LNICSGPSVKLVNNEIAKFFFDCLYDRNLLEMEESSIVDFQHFHEENWSVLLSALNQNPFLLRDNGMTDQQLSGIIEYMSGNELNLEELTYLNLTLRKLLILILIKSNNLLIMTV